MSSIEVKDHSQLIRQPLHQLAQPPQLRQINSGVLLASDLESGIATPQLGLLHGEGDLILGELALPHDMHLEHIGPPSCRSLCCRLVRNLGTRSSEVVSCVEVYYQPELIFFRHCLAPHFAEEGLRAELARPAATLPEASLRHVDHADQGPS